MRLVGTERVKQVENLIDNPVGSGAVAINFVYHHYGVKPALKSFSGYEPGLRHRPIDSVYKQEYRIYHRQHALHLATKIGVPRGVDDIDTVVPP